VGKAAVKPLEFITIARQLGKNSEEINLRVAASRAYYGVFHFAGERLEQLTVASPNPFRWTGARKNHEGLRAEWRNRFGTTGHAIANALFYAHELRKKADYDLHLVFTSEDKDETFQFVAQAILAVRRAR
jgi:uncharacterized protein (UPF0332 family)